MGDEESEDEELMEQEQRKRRWPHEDRGWQKRTSVETYTILQILRKGCMERIGTYDI